MRVKPFAKGFVFYFYFFVYFLKVNFMWHVPLCGAATVEQIAIIRLRRTYFVPSVASLSLSDIVIGRGFDFSRWFIQVFRARGQNTILKHLPIRHITADSYRYSEPVSIYFTHPKNVLTVVVRRSRVHVVHKSIRLRGFLLNSEKNLDHVIFDQNISLKGCTMYLLAIYWGAKFRKIYTCYSVLGANRAQGWRLPPLDSFKLLKLRSSHRCT